MAKRIRRAVQFSWIVARPRVGSAGEFLYRPRLRLGGFSLGYLQNLTYGGGMNIQVHYWRPWVRVFWQDREAAKLACRVHGQPPHPRALF